MTARYALQQAILWPGYLLYRTIGPENTQLLSDFLDIASNRRPVRCLAKYAVRSRICCCAHAIV